MESFSTLPRPLVPVVTNVATLAVLVCATVWSGAQRPNAVGAQLSKSEATTVPAVLAAPAEVRSPAYVAPEQTEVVTAAHRHPADLKAEVATEVATLQRVGYQTPVASLAAKPTLR